MTPLPPHLCQELCAPMENIELDVWVSVLRSLQHGLLLKPWLEGKPEPFLQSGVSLKSEPFLQSDFSEKYTTPTSVPTKPSAFSMTEEEQQQLLDRQANLRERWNEIYESPPPDIVVDYPEDPAWFDLVKFPPFHIIDFFCKSGHRSAAAQPGSGVVPTFQQDTK